MRCMAKLTFFIKSAIKTSEDFRWFDFLFVISECAHYVPLLFTAPKPKKNGIVVEGHSFAVVLPTATKCKYHRYG